MADMDPVWVHNLRSFIEDKFPPDDQWRVLFREHFDKQNAEVKSLRSELEAVKREAVEALKPFGDAAVSYDPPDSEDDEWAAWAHDFTIGSLRAARAFVEKHGRDG